MASGTIESPIQDIKLVHTTKGMSGTLGAFAGGGTSITPVAPTGYKFLAHVNIYNTDVAGVLCFFDGAATTESVYVYQYNAKNATQNRGTIHLLSLYYK